MKTAKYMEEERVIEKGVEALMKERKKLSWE